jgi:hypothetical protein
VEIIVAFGKEVKSISVLWQTKNIIKILTTNWEGAI